MGCEKTSKNLAVITFDVVKGKTGFLLRYQKVSAWNVIKVINKIETLNDIVENEYPELFWGIGK